MSNELMTKEDRRKVILRFLDRHDLALPPAPLYYNMKEQMFVTFSKRTMDRHLKEMREEGLVKKIERGDGYWAITDKGSRYISEGTD